jgi:leader peptidase (prepilin peptidase)/N-methyltransferase
MNALTIADFPPEFLQVCAVLMGLIWGSFLNVVIHRLPRGMSVARPASHCPACKTPIPVYRNIPLVSWLLMRGKAPCCGVKVSGRYAMVELAGGVLSLAVLEVHVLTMAGSTPFLHALALYVAELALLLGLTAAAFIDLEHMIIPDSISIGGTLLGVATFALRNMELVDAALGAVVGFVLVWLPFVVLYEKLRGTAGMGLGDAKLLMLAGAWLGWEGTLFVLGAGAIQGSLVFIALALLGKPLEEPEAVVREREELKAELEKLTPEERAEIEAELKGDPLAEDPEEGWGKARIAFGPFLILATMECLLIGPDRIMQWILQI